MPEIQPFGTNPEQAYPLSVDKHIFLGLTVVDFNCNSNWSSEGAQCNINLIQDVDQYLENVVVGSPQYFEIISSDNVPIFRFYGILMDISRSTDSSSKKYKVTLQSPSVLLEAVSIITDSFAGYGGALEAYGANVPTCIDFGSRNSTLNVSNIYNILNVFGVFENDSYGEYGAGFGRSAINDNGIRIDAIAYAVNELVNGNTSLTPALGSNIIYGANGYNNNSAYAYNFDIIGFLNSLSNFIPNDYRVKDIKTLMDLVTEVCELTNHSFCIDLLKPPEEGSEVFASGHISTRIPIQTHGNTVYGGQIVIIVQNMNNFSDKKFPLSAYIVGRELSDKLGGIGQIQDLPLDIGMRGSAHPDGLPIATNPIGGEFKTEEIELDDISRASQTNIRVKLNNGATGYKYVVGGYQSRINYVCSYGKNINVSPEILGSTCSSNTSIDLDLTPDVYWYWGEIKTSLRTGAHTKNVPVITPILDDFYSDAVDFIMIDMYEIFGELTVPYLFRNGIYLASVVEVETAMNSLNLWLDYLVDERLLKINALLQICPEIPIAFNFFAQTNDTVESSLNPLNKSAYGDKNSKLQYTYELDLKKILEGQVSRINKMWETIKKIGDDHLGKSFIVKAPAYSIKSDNGNESPLNSYIKSWNISPDAYLDPGSYPTFEAPDGPFVKNGRVSAYANYYLSGTPRHDPITSEAKSWGREWNVSAGDGEYFTFLDPDTATLPYRDVIIDDNSMSPTFGQVVGSKVSFKNYSSQEVYIRPLLNKPGNRYLVSVPLELDEDYIPLTPLYFTLYNWSLVVTRGTLGTSEYDSLTPAIDLLTSLALPYNGVGCIPFIKCTTKGVYSLFPRSIPPYQDISSNLSESEDKKKKDAEARSSSLTNDRKPESAFISAITPKSFGIPQQSTRYVYGPWTTNLSLPYGTKVEYIHDTSLVPENYIIPASVNIGQEQVTLLSGYEGLNTAGQLLANTVDNFDFLFTEEGTVTFPEFPRITTIGQALIDGGPLVSDISVSIGTDGVSTTYNMSTYAPKFGKMGKYLSDKLTSFAKRIKR